MLSVFYLSASGVIIKTFNVVLNVLYDITACVKNVYRNEEEQNLIAYQYKGHIYYRAYKEIKKGMELLVWYGNQYAEQLGIALKNLSINIPVDNFKFSGKF